MRLVLWRLVEFRATQGAVIMYEILSKIMQQTITEIAKYKFPITKKIYHP